MTATEPQPAPKPKGCWYRLTPDRLVIGLLVVEGCLLLSERWGWFAFNEHKGYTVLIAVATVGVALVAMFLWFLASLISGWRFQFGVRSLLGLVPVDQGPADRHGAVVGGSQGRGRARRLGTDRRGVPARPLGPSARILAKRHPGLGPLLLRVAVTWMTTFSRERTT